MASYLGNSPETTLKVRASNYRYVATAGQTTFSGTDSNSLSMFINTADVEVFLNGVLLDQTDYSYTNSSVTLASGATVNDIVEVITNNEYLTANVYSKDEADAKVATAISDLVGTAGSALNTLGELSDALDDDANYAATITTALGTKANTSSLGTLATISPTGTADSTKFLRGDNSWQTISVTPTAVSGQANTATDYFGLPSGSTAQRPASPADGMMRYNTTTSQSEVYQSGTWVAFATSSASSVNYLIVAGGGGASSGGAGAGGMLTGTSSVSAGTTYTITVGGGGTGVAVNSNSGTNGGDSAALGLTAIGGGRGAAIGDVGGSAGNGGSGGGGGGFSGGLTNGGSGTTGQGNAGGTNSGYTGSPYPAGGGGGKSAVGANASGPTSGNGGAGAASSISGSSVNYAGGGGGGSYNGGTPGSGGSGGGGNGSGTGAGAAGSANTGGGGGGCQASYTGGNGGSGVVIISYSNAYNQATATGSYSYNSTGGNNVYIFTGSGSITF